MRPPLIIRHPSPVFVPQPDVPWASEMVLNPTIWQRNGEGRIHLLFRASGPGSGYAGHPEPFPIHLGYGWSDDDGATWHGDFSRPALSPRLAESLADLTVHYGSRTGLNYANGCIEDPRLFEVEGVVYLSVACRVFPPGAYWIKDDPMQCAPAWVAASGQPLCKALSTNLTVTVLYQVDLEALQQGCYSDAFSYLGPITDSEKSDNRDAFLFPERLLINGVKQYVLLHRPKHPEAYAKHLQKPTIFISCAEQLSDLASKPSLELPLAAPLFGWEDNRVGGSTPPVRIDERLWLFPYHGKQDDRVGYTQNFMILEETGSGLPVLKHRCSDRLMIAEDAWELHGKFQTPCVFTCGAIHVGENLLMTYGAADTVCGVASVPFQELVSYVQTFDACGVRIG